jgi:hypothetical protein
MAALALNNKHLTASPVQVTEAQTKNFAATQPTQHHRFEHGPIPQPPTRPQQGINLSRLSNPRQSPWCPHQRNPTLTTIP